jgi:DNA-nicking Smr family endonuclease
MPTRRHDAEADLAAWSRYLESVTPLPGRRKPARPVAPPAPAVEVVAMPQDMPSRRIDRPARRQAPAPLAIGAPPAGLDRATWGRFHGGRMTTTRSLDLHGMTVAHAHQAVAALIMDAAARGERCVEIVTGHGRRLAGAEGGALRREVPLWLEAPPLRALVLAVSHPHPANPGALRVLLRRRRERR